MTEHRVAHKGFYLDQSPRAERGTEYLDVARLFRHRADQGVPVFHPDAIRVQDGAGTQLPVKDIVGISITRRLVVVSIEHTVAGLARHHVFLGGDDAAAGRFAGDLIALVSADRPIPPVYTDESTA